MKNKNLKQLSTRQPTYWPSDPNKIPEFVDFCVTKGIDTKKFTGKSFLDLTSDHTPTLITMFTHIPGKSKKSSFYCKKNRLELF